MVKLVLKKGDEAQFLYETTVDTLVDDVLADVSAIYNGRLKVQRLCAGRFKSGVCRLLYDRFCWQ